jgi:hypothetical protein
MRFSQQWLCRARSSGLRDHVVRWKLTEVLGDILPQSPEWKNQPYKDSEKSEAKEIHFVTSDKIVIYTVINQLIAHIKSSIQKLTLIQIRTSRCCLLPRTQNSDFDKVKATFRTTVSQSVSLGVEQNLRLTTIYLLLFGRYGLALSWDSRPVVLFFQLNTCGHSLYVTSSLWREGGSFSGPSHAGIMTTYFYLRFVFLPERELD